MNKLKTCYVVILNYENWIDTIECLDSVFQSDDIKVKVIVCDNWSHDDSVEKIIGWADGRVSIEDINKQCYFKNRFNKKIKYNYWDNPKYIEYAAELLIVNNGENRGFSAGNNVGIKIAISQKDCDAIFVLNNDTVIEKETIKWGVEKLLSDESFGICSTNVRYYYNPDESGWGEKTYVPFLGREISGEIIKRFGIQKYTGMSFFVKPEFIKKIGYMNERYFLYYEELDWVERSKNMFNIVREPRSLVYHKEGKSISYQSKFSKECMFKSQLIFMNTYYGRYVWIVCVKKIVYIFMKTIMGDKDVWGMGKILLNFLFYKKEFLDENMRGK